MEEVGKVSTKVIGAAGEHYVMHCLLKRGLIAALAPEGVPNMDIIVTDINSKKLCSIQVKTCRSVSAKGGWPMKKKHENIISKDLFYCFVDLGEANSNTVQTYVIPSAIVAEILKLSHAYYLSTPGKRGQQRGDSDMRLLEIGYSYSDAFLKEKYPDGWMKDYFERWDLISP